MSLSFSLTRRRDNPSPFVPAGTISHCLLSASARSCNSAFETDGFSGKPAVGRSNVGAVAGGKACSEAIGSFESGAMVPFLILFPRSEAGVHSNQ